jgi:STE24 endopeptidase
VRKAKRDPSLRSLRNVAQGKQDDDGVGFFKHGFERRRLAHHGEPKSYFCLQLTFSCVIYSFGALMKSWACLTLLLFLLQVAGPAYGAASTRELDVLVAHSGHLSLRLPQNAPENSAAQNSPAGVTTSGKRVTAYTLPPELYRKARDLGRFRFRFALIDFFYSVFVLWFILYWRFGPKFRDWAETVSKNRFVQAAVFTPLLILTMSVMTLPSDVYEQSVERKYGLSVQRWGSWFWDWAKVQFLGVILAIILVSILYAVIRRSPRRWWLYFWAAMVPIAVILVFIQPLVVDPMFHKFQPLQQKDPALTASLEQMVRRAGENIPPERMFWMGAGKKTTELNAYVTGIGASKRIVVWDNTIAKMTTPQIVLVAGHEMGHYVLGHIWKGLIFAAIFLFVLFYCGFRTIEWVLKRWGKGWGIRGLDDWASLPALLLILSIYTFIATPVTSAFSRYLEHQADQYGLEVTHGLLSDSSQVAAQAFQVLGEVDLSDPNPNTINLFMFYSHPTIADRIRFALTYDPWSQGKQPEFVK